MRRPYPQFTLIIALLLSAVVLALYNNLLAIFLAAFPDMMTRSVCAGVVVLLCWVFFRHGSAAALALEQNGAALSAFPRRPMPANAEATSLLAEAAALRVRGKKDGQTDFQILYSKTADKFASWMEESIERIETTILLLFYLGMFFTVIAIVMGFAFNKAPSGPEEAKIMSYAIIKGLGLAYAISGTCVGSAVILFLLNAFLKAHLEVVNTLFIDALYEVAMLGTPVEIEAATETKSAEVRDAQPSTT